MLRLIAFNEKSIMRLTINMVIRSAYNGYIYATKVIGLCRDYSDLKRAEIAESHQQADCDLIALVDKPDHVSTPPYYLIELLI